MDFTLDINNTNVKIFLAPALVSFITIAIVRIFSGAWLGSVLAPIGIGMGFLASYFLTMGLPLWPVATVLGALPFAAASGVLVGSALDVRSTNNSTLTMLHIIISLVLVFWVASLWHGGTFKQDELVLYGILILSGFWVMQRLNELRDEGLAPAISIFSACVGLSVIATIYGTRTSLFSSGLAAAVFGYMVWNWPRCRFPWGSSGTLVGGGVYIILASELAIKNPSLAMPIGLTLLSFIIFDITNRLFPTNATLQPFIQVLFSSLPIAAAVFLV